MCTENDLQSLLSTFNIDRESLHIPEDGYLIEDKSYLKDLNVVYHQTLIEFITREIGHDFANPITTIQVNNDFLNSTVEKSRVIDQTLESNNKQLNRVKDTINKIRHHKFDNLDQILTREQMYQVINLLVQNKLYSLEIYFDTGISFDMYPTSMAILLRYLAEISVNNHVLTVISKEGSSILLLVSIPIPPDTSKFDILNIVQYDHITTFNHFLKKFMRKYGYKFESHEIPKDGRSYLKLTISNT